LMKWRLCESDKPYNINNHDHIKLTESSIKGFLAGDFFRNYFRLVWR
jgi:hypothetical protein